MARASSAQSALGSMPGRSSHRQADNRLRPGCPAAPATARPTTACGRRGRLRRRPRRRRRGRIRRGRVPHAASQAAKARADTSGPSSPRSTTAQPVAVRRACASGGGPASCDRVPNPWAISPSPEPDPHRSTGLAHAYVGQRAARRGELDRGRVGEAVGGLGVRQVGIRVRPRQPHRQLAIAPQQARLEGQDAAVRPVRRRGLGIKRHGHGRGPCPGGVKRVKGRRGLGEPDRHQPIHYRCGPDRGQERPQDKGQ